MSCCTLTFSHGLAWGGAETVVVMLNKLMGRATVPPPTIHETPGLQLSWDFCDHNNFCLCVIIGPEDVSSLRGVLISEGGMYRLQWSWDLKMCPY